MGDGSRGAEPVRLLTCHDMRLGAGVMVSPVKEPGGGSRIALGRSSVGDGHGKSDDQSAIGGGRFTVRPSAPAQPCSLDALSRPPQVPSPESASGDGTSEPYMTTRTLELPRITTLVPVRPRRPAVPSPQPRACRDSTNRELVLCARGRGDDGSGRWEHWLFAPLVIAGSMAILAAATTAGQWTAQWQVFVRWAERILL